MKNIAFTYILFILLFASGSISFAQDEERPEPEKTSTGHAVSETFLYKSSEANAASITNKHGNITIDAWDKDSIKIIYDINVGTFDEDLAKETLDQITVYKYISGKKLHLTTRFEENFQSSFTFSINYHLYVPATLKAEITSNFGNIYFNGMQEEVYVKADYGKLFINNDSVNLKLARMHLSFFETEISNTDTVNFYLNNSTLNIKNIRKMSGKTNFSVLNGDSIQFVKLTTNIDRLNLNEIYSINIKGEKTFCTVNNLKYKGHFEINSGGLNVSVKRSLKSLTVANTKANTTVSVPTGLGYLLHGEVKQGKLTHYSQNELKVLRDIDTVTFSGEFGNDPKANITLFNTMSNLTVKRH